MNTAFDSYAIDYDQHFTNTPVGHCQRMQVDKALMPLLNNEKRVLEINCGTGHDAMRLAPLVRSYLATDASAEMIAVAKSKMMEGSNAPVFACRSIQELEAELAEADVIFSNFGGLNCLSTGELALFADRCNQHSGENAELFFVIMGRHCAWEWLYYMMKRRPEEARRRKRNSVEVHVGESAVTTYYYSPSEIRKIFKGFDVVESGPIGLFVPPSYLNQYFERHPRMLRFLSMMDKVFAHHLMSDLGDHYFIRLTRS